MGIYWVPLPLERAPAGEGETAGPGQFLLRSACPRRGVDRSTALFGRDTHGISGRAWGMVGWLGKMRVFRRFSQENGD